VQYVVAVDAALLAHLATGALRLQLRAAGDHALLAAARVPLRPLIEAAPVGLGASACRHTVELVGTGGERVVRCTPGRCPGAASVLRAPAETHDGHLSGGGARRSGPAAADARLPPGARRPNLAAGGWAWAAGGCRGVRMKALRAALATNRAPLTVRGDAQGTLACGASLMRPLAFALRAHLADTRGGGAPPAAGDDAAAGERSSCGARTADGSAGSAGSGRLRVRRPRRERGGPGGGRDAAARAVGGNGGELYDAQACPNAACVWHSVAADGQVRATPRRPPAVRRAQNARRRRRRGPSRPHGCRRARGAGGAGLAARRAARGGGGRGAAPGAGRAGGRAGAAQRVCDVQPAAAERAGGAAVHARRAGRRGAAAPGLCPGAPSPRGAAPPGAIPRGAPRRRGCERCSAVFGHRLARSDERAGERRLEQGR